jgi:hypothetical protein
LRTALDGWKKGDKPAALKSASPPIVVQDFGWMAGQVLFGDEVLGDGKHDDADRRIPIRLTLGGPNGREVKKGVSYVIGTGPTSTIFRVM